MEYEDTAGTLDPCYGTQNKQKNINNNMIEVEIRTLSMKVYRLPSNVNPVSKNFTITFDSFTRYTQY